MLTIPRTPCTEAWGRRFPCQDLAEVSELGAAPSPIWAAPPPTPLSSLPRAGAPPHRNDFKGPVPELPQPARVRGPQGRGPGRIPDVGAVAGPGSPRNRPGCGAAASGAEGRVLRAPRSGRVGPTAGPIRARGERRAGGGGTGTGGSGAGRGVQAAAAAAAAPQCPARAPAAVPARDAPLRDPARPFALGLPPGGRAGLQRTPHHLAGESGGPGAAGRCWF